MQVVLAYKDRAGSSQLRSDIGICGRNAVFVNRACRRGTHTGSVNHVFQPDGNAMQRTAPTPRLNFFLCFRRFSKRRFRGDGDESIKGRVQALNRFQTLARYLHERDSALLNQFGHLRNGTQTHFAPSYPAARIVVRACL